MITAFLKESRTNRRKLAARLALFAAAAGLFAWAIDWYTNKKLELQAASVDAILPEFQKHKDFTPISSRTVAMNRGGVLPEGEAYPSVTISFRSDFPTESGRCDVTIFDCGSNTQASITRDRIRAVQNRGAYSSGRFLILADAGGIQWLQRHYTIE